MSLSLHWMKFYQIKAYIEKELKKYQFTHNGWFPNGQITVDNLQLERKGKKYHLGLIYIDINTIKIQIWSYSLNDGKGRVDILIDEIIDVNCEISLELQNKIKMILKKFVKKIDYPIRKKEFLNFLVSLEKRNIYLPMELKMMIWESMFI